MRLIYAVFPVVFLLTGPALADLNFCNDTGLRASVAIGYKKGDDWVSEGWWTMEPGDCATVAPGNLRNRYYYWRATNEHGVFRTEDFYFCVSPKAFTIIGDTECEARGHERLPFVEEDTGDLRDATIRLTAADAPLGRKSRTNSRSGSRTNSNTALPAAGSDFETIVANLQGLWEDAQDDTFHTLVSGTHLVDKFAGIPGAEADFELADSCEGADGAGPVMLVRYDGDADVLCWVLLKLTGDELVFRAIGGARDVRMIKKD